MRRWQYYLFGVLGFLAMIGMLIVFLVTVVFVYLGLVVVLFVINVVLFAMYSRFKSREENLQEEEFQAFMNSYKCVEPDWDDFGPAVKSFLQYMEIKDWQMDEVTRPVGRLYKGNPIMIMDVVMEHGQRMARTDDYRNWRRFIMVLAEIPLENGFLRLRPERVKDKLKKIAGKMDIQVEDEAFNRAFYITGSPRNFVLEFLDENIRQYLLNYQKWTVIVHNGKLFAYYQRPKLKKEEIDPRYPLCDHPEIYTAGFETIQGLIDQIPEELLT